MTSAFSHPSTNQAQPCLASEIRWDRARTGWYGHRLTSAFSWQNSVSLCPASFCTPRPNLPVTPGISWLPTFTFQSPIMKRTSFWGVSSRSSYRSSKNHSTSASLVLLVGAETCGLLWYWMVCLGNEQKLFCRFWDWIQVLHFRLFCWLWWLLYFFQGILAHSGRHNGHLS